MLQAAAAAAAAAATKEAVVAVAATRLPELHVERQHHGHMLLQHAPFPLMAVGIMQAS